MNATSTTWTSTPETLGDEPRPTAAENCAWVEVIMARNGWKVVTEPLTLDNAIEWLRCQSWSWDQVLSAMAYTRFAARLTEISAPGWRLLCTHRAYTLLTVSQR